MLALVGFAVGYVVGAQQGREGMARLVSSAKEIQSSDEFAALVESARALLVVALQQVLPRGTDVVAGEVKGAVNRRMRAA